MNQQMKLWYTIICNIQENKNGTLLWTAQAKQSAEYGIKSLGIAMLIVVNINKQQLKAIQSSKHRQNKQADKQSMPNE